MIAELKKILSSTERYIRRCFVPSQQGHWFYNWIARCQTIYSKGYGPPGNIYFEFGVFEGKSLLEYISAAKRYCKKKKRSLDEFHIYVFDSFSGLPAKEVGDHHVDWKKGMFACGIEDIRSKVKKTGFPLSNLNLIPGYYAESLTHSLRESLFKKNHIPSIVMIDCDYYSSTKTILDWLQPMLKSGTIFYFDDYWSFHGHPDYGELRAINEFNKMNQGRILQRGCVYGLGEHTFIYSRESWEYQ